MTVLIHLYCFLLFSDPISIIFYQLLFDLLHFSFITDNIFLMWMMMMIMNLNSHVLQKRKTKKWQTKGLQEATGKTDFLNFNITKCIKLKIVNYPTKKICTKEANKMTCFQGNDFS